MRNKTLIFGLAMVVMPAMVSAQTDAGAQGEGSAEAKGRADAQSRIETSIEHAMTVGIPVSLLESKIAEGKAKGVSMTRIAAAVEHRLEVLTRAQAALSAHGEAVATAELAAAANAMEAGANKDNVREVRESAAPEQRPAALTLLAELIADGRLPAQAVAGVQTAIDAQSATLLRLQGQGGAGSSANAAAKGDAAAQAGKAIGAAAKAAGTLKIGGGKE
jgi:hypothetical protein